MDIVNARSEPQAASTIGEFAKQQFMPSYVLALTKSGQLHYEGLLNLHVLPAFNDTKPDELKTNHIQEWINGKAETLSRNYVTQMRNCLVTLYNYMARCGVYEGRNPAQGVKIPKTARKPKKTQPYSIEELRILLPHFAARPRGCPLWEIHVLGPSTSMHGGEVAGVKIEDANLFGEKRWIEDRDVPHGHIYCRRAYVRNEYTDDKNEYRHRVVSIPAALHEKIRARFYHPETGELRDPSEPLFVMPGTWARHKKALPIDTGNITSRIFKKIEEKVGFEVNWHRFRATYATETKTLGMDDQDRMNGMGHASLKMTESYTDQTARMAHFGNKIAEQLIGSEAVQ